jgi:hypothetical protein
MHYPMGPPSAALPIAARSSSIPPGLTSLADRSLIGSVRNLSGDLGRIARTAVITR